MTAALIFMGMAAINAQFAHRRAVRGCPVAPVVVDGIVRKAAAGVAFFVIFGWAR